MKYWLLCWPILNAEKGEDATIHCSVSPPEHPRAPTTDDVECFFSVLSDHVGKNFTTKNVRL